MKYVLAILCLAVCSCQGNSKDKFPVGEKTDSILHVKGMKKLQLDGMEKPSSGFVRYCENNGEPCLIQGNVNQKTIGIYDYVSGAKRMTVETERADGEFFAYTPDTAFVIANGRGKSTVHMWADGKNASMNVSVAVRKFVDR